MPGATYDPGAVCASTPLVSFVMLTPVDSAPIGIGSPSGRLPPISVARKSRSSPAINPSAFRSAAAS